MPLLKAKKPLKIELSRLYLAPKTSVKGKIIVAGDLLPLLNNNLFNFRVHSLKLPVN